MNTIQVELPDEFLSLAKTGDALPSRSAAKLIALELFREQLISAGKAAELAGISLDEFMAFSAQRDVSLHYGAADWEQDQMTLRELKL
jgi:predicted HTH domain antitoxin